MIAAGTGLVTGKRADEAALDAAREAMAASGATEADLALVFTTGEAYPHGHALLHAVRRVTGARIVLGVSAAGVITEKNFFHNLTGVLAVVPQPRTDG